MRIAYIAAGAAGMYCGSCLHDNTLATALQAAGHEVALVPVYTPLRTDEEDVSLDRVFYGAVNVYLQQKTALFRHTPAFIDRLLDRRGLLDQVSRFAGATDAHELGALTLSVLRGEEGRQAKELSKLVDWLAAFEPDVVQLTNAMLLGFAAEIRRVVGAPVVCGLTGEDLFLDELPEPYRGEVEAEMRRRAADADGFVATSLYYADTMRRALGVEPERMHVAQLGINLEGHQPPAGERHPDAPFVVGYLARQCPEKGLHLLVDAFRLLVEGWDAERPRPRLRVAGWIASRDRPFVEEQQRRLASWGLGADADFLGIIERDEKLAFLSGLDVLSVPTVYREPKGLYVLEALAHGVPVVEPNHGAFPELVQSTRAGLLVPPESPEALAEGLRRLALDPKLRRELGRRGRAAVEERYSAPAMAEATLAVYRKVLAQRTKLAAAG